MSKIIIDAHGMKGQRSRNINGPLRKKRNDTNMGTIEVNYKIDLDVRSDMKLKTFLKKNKLNSLNDLINKK